MDQVPTAPTTVRAIMSTPEFALGVADARAGRPYRHAYECWDGNAQWNYERGRQWAQLAPRHIVLKQNGTITANAMRFYSRSIR
jgi:hypothetical protein